MFITKKKLEQMLSEREMKGREERSRKMEIMDLRVDMYRLEAHLKNEINKVVRGMAEIERELHPEKQQRYCPFEPVKE